MTGTQEKYQYLFSHMTEAFALCEIICDEKGVPCDYRFLEVNKAFEEQTGIVASTIVGKTILEFYPDIEKSWIDIYGEVALTKKSHTFINYNHNTKRYYDVSAFAYKDGLFALLFKDITERKRVEEALQESERRLSDAQRVGKIGSFTFDITVGLWYGTDMLYSILGIAEKKEYTVDDWVNIIHPDHRERLLSYQQSVLEQKIPFDKEYLIVRQTDGETRWVHSLGELQFDEKGNVIGMLGTTQDITEAKQAKDELQKAKDNLEMRVEQRTRELSIAKKEAEVASKAKSEFLSSMSHELRTPMNAVLGFAQLLDLDRASLNENQQTAVREILNGGYHLLELIDEVLDLSKIEAGRLKLHVKEVSLPEIIDECDHLTAALTESAGIQIDFAQPEKYIVQADPTRLKQVLLNYLSNAIKYNHPQGRVQLHYEPIAENRLKISVSDTGIGLDKEQLSRLFTPFERVGAETSTIEGTGIGLALSKKLVELMGGCVGVSSQKGKGSTFWLELDYKNSRKRTNKGAESKIGEISS